MTSPSPSVPDSPQPAPADEPIQQELPAAEPAPPVVPQPDPAPPAEPAPEPEQPDPAAVEAWLNAEKLVQWLEAEKAWMNALDDGWPHRRMEFRNDYLAYRKPGQAPLQAVAITSQGSQGMRFLNQFFELYLGPDSYIRVWTRLMDPDDEDYSVESIGALINQMGEID